MGQLDQKVVLVVGAGAAVDYGFPTGQGLLDKIANGKRILPVSNASRIGLAKRSQLREEWRNSNRLTDGTVTWADVYARLDGSWQLGECERNQNEFRKALRESGQRSVDAFLASSHKNSERFASIGKAATAYYLMRQEYRAACRRILTRGWYQELFLRSFDQHGQPHPGLRVITFNYDVSLELALSMMNTNSHPHCFNEARVGVGRLGIHHVYGRTDFPAMWHFYENRMFDKPIDIAEDWNPHFGRVTAQAAENIRIIGEERAGDEADPAWKQWLLDAKQVVFLGFGFNETNLKTIGAHVDEKPWREALARGLEVKATAYKLGDSGKQRARALLGLTDEQGDFLDCDCETLLREKTIVGTWDPGKSWT